MPCANGTQFPYTCPWQFFTWQKKTQNYICYKQVALLAVSLEKSNGCMSVKSASSPFFFLTAELFQSGREVW